MGNFSKTFNTNFKANFGNVFSAINATWTPSQLNTAGWWDASDISTITDSGGAVSQWDDKSGNRRHVKQATGSKRPTAYTRTIGGLNAIDFDEVALQVMQTDDVATWLNGTNYYIFMVFKNDATDESRYICGTDQSSDNKGLHTGWRSGSDWTIAQFNNDIDYALPRNTVDSYATIINNGSGSQFYFNGTSVGTDPLPNAYLNTDTGVFNVGAGRTIFGSTWCGLIGEIVIVTGSMSAGDITNMHSYISDKWSI